MTSLPGNEPSQTSSLIDKVVDTAVRAMNRGDRPLARRLLSKAAEMDPTREDVWLWLAAAAETPAEALACFRAVLALNPHNQKAQKGLRWAQGQASACPLCGSLLAAGEEVCPACGHLQDRAASIAPATPAGPPPALHASGELAPSFVLSVEQAEAIDATLERLAYESEARYIILADITGQLISERGNTRHLNTQVLSALAAGELVATYELARLVGERARFKLLLHEGEKQSVYLSDVGEQLILVIVFDNSTPIGLVRMILKQAIEELMPLLAQVIQPDASGVAGRALNASFRNRLRDALDASMNEQHEIS